MTLRGEILYEDDDFSLSLERVSGHALCHCGVTNSSVSIIRKCKAVIRRLVCEKAEDGYALCSKENTKLKRFLKLVGFQYIRNIWGLDDQGKDQILELWRVGYNDKSV